MVAMAVPDSPRSPPFITTLAAKADADAFTFSPLDISCITPSCWANWASFDELPAQRDRVQDCIAIILAVVRKDHSTGAASRDELGEVAVSCTPLGFDVHILRRDGSVGLRVYDSRLPTPPVLVHGLLTGALSGRLWCAYDSSTFDVLGDEDERWETTCLRASSLLDAPWKFAVGIQAAPTGRPLYLCLCLHNVHVRALVPKPGGSAHASVLEEATPFEATWAFDKRVTGLAFHGATTPHVMERPTVRDVIASGVAGKWGKGAL